MKKYLYFLLLICLIAFFLRAWDIKTNLLYHYDQGLHAIDIYKIWHDHKFSLLGHITDVDGIVQAPIYYWLMTPSYFLGKGDPAAASIFQIILETVSLPFLFFAVRFLFDRRTAVLTLIFYAFSFGMISQSRWLSNVTPIIAFSNFLLFLFVYQLKHRANSFFIFATSLTIGIIIQLNAAIGIFLIPFLFWFYRKKINLLSISLIFAGIILPGITLIIFQFRHDFITVKAILNFISTPGKGIGFSPKIFVNNLEIFLNQVNAAVSYPIKIVSGIFFFLGILKLWKSKNRNFVYAFFLLPFIFLGLFQRGAISFFFDSEMVLGMAVAIYGFTYFPQIIMYGIFLILLSLNIFNLPAIYKPTNALTPIGDANVITLQDRKNVIDWIYKKADGKNFAIWYYTIPYYHDEPWDYLFTIYAGPKYKYLPEATQGFSPNDLKTSEYFFDVYEPEFDKSRLEKQNLWFTQVGKNFGTAVDYYRSNDVIVELRSWKPYR